MIKVLTTWARHTQHCRAGCTRRFFERNPFIDHRPGAIHGRTQGQSIFNDALSKSMGLQDLARQSQNCTLQLTMRKK